MLPILPLAQIITIANNTPLFVAKISDNVIGVQTFKVGMGSTGTFVGIADTTMNSGLLSFTGIGTGTKHSIETVKTNVVTAEVIKKYCNCCDSINAWIDDWR